ncbi:MAG: ArnT family glycosyltransferase [Gemmataceae bacterium]
MFRQVMWLLFALFLVLTLPLFLRMPLFVDPYFYGICAQTIRHGGVLERDLLFFYPPGMAWLRAVIDSVSRRPEFLRVVDLLIVAGVACLLARWGRDRLPPVRSGLTALVLIAFYLTTPETNHAQPDVWMLLPALGALSLRQRRTDELLADATPGARPGRAYAEGLLCGAVCLLKPHGAVPLAAVWIVAALLARRRQLLADAVLVLAGGLTVFALWMLWLQLGGGWNSFWLNLRTWGGAYQSTQPPLLLRVGNGLVQFLPLSLLHVPMAALAVLTLVRAGRPAADILRATAYLGFLFEGVFLQWAFSYQTLPALLLMGTLLLPRVWQTEGRSLWFRGIASFVCLAVLCPLLAPDKLALWSRCWTGDDLPDLRDQLTFSAPYPAHIHVVFPIERKLSPKAKPQHLFRGNWSDLAGVADFLRNEHVSDSEVSCYHATTSPLYVELGIQPCSRIIWPDAALLFYPQRAEAIRAELAGHRPRFIVSDLRRATHGDPGPSSPTADGWTLPDNFPPRWIVRYPWTEPIVFRSGCYAVHRARGPVAPLSGFEYPD